MDKDKFTAHYLFILGTFDISDDEIGALWKYVPTDKSDCADAFRAPVPLSSCELVQLHTVGNSAMLPTKKRVVMKGNRFPGKEEERSSFRTAPCGLLEPWSQNTRTTGAMASHMASHRGFAGKNCVPTFRSRSCCNVWTPQDTLKRPRGAVLTRILLNRPRRLKTSSCRGRLPSMRTRRRTGRWKEKLRLPASQDLRPEAVLPLRPAAPMRTTGASRKKKDLRFPLDAAQTCRDNGARWPIPTVLPLV